MAVTLGVLAVAYSNVGNPDIVVPWLWPSVFAVDAVVMAAFGCTPRSRILYSIAGPVMVVSLLSRPAAVIIDYTAGYNRNGWPIVIALVVYGGLAVLLQWWWLAHVGNWRLRHETEMQAKGD